MQRYNSIHSFLVRSIPYVAIFLLVATLFITNYVPGTWLSGWDNLHPELNCSINIIDRSLFSVWQEYQGLGVRAGNAHAADLLHQVGVCAASTVIPLPLIRYLYHFLALFVGGIGVYLCSKKLFLKKSSPTIQSIAALCGALWYILNIGTMQYISVPYEAFSHFFAAFPWIILGTLLYLKHPTKNRAWVFAGIILLSTPAFYIPTLFVVTTGVLGIITLIHIGQRKPIKSLLFVWIAYLCINAFWLFPFVAFLFHGTAFVGQTMINRMFTEEAFLRNQQFGTLPDIALLKGFLFNTSDLVVASNTHDFVMRPWIDFLKHPIPYSTHCAVCVLVLVGIVISWKQKHTYRIFLTILLAIGLFAFVNDNPPTGIIFRFFQDHLPLFKQVFRFPFTKFLPLIAFSYATALSITLSLLFSKPILRILAAGFMITYIGIANIPSFQGNFIYKEMRVVIPQEYFSLFSFLNTQPNGIIATFPQATYWGWTTYDWGYRGSGFPWYGIKQPILDRNFDVWNTHNEQYYQTLIKALYTTHDATALLDVFTTYNISYLWIDEHVILPGNPDALYFDELKYRLATLPSISLLFKQGKQSLYKVNTHHDAFLNLQQKTSSIRPFANNAHVTTTQHADGSITLSTPIPSGLLTIPSQFTSNEIALGIAKQHNAHIIVTPNTPILFTDDEYITTATASSITIPIPQQTTISSVNDTIMSENTATTISLSNTNTIKTYATPSQQSDITTSLLTQPIKNCASDTRTAAFFGITGQTLIGKASTPCVYGQLSALTKRILPTTATAIMQIQLSYTTTGPTPRICLTKPGMTECLYRFQEELTAIKNTVTETTYTLTPNTPIANLWMKIEFDAPETQEEKVTINTIFVSVYTTPSSIQQFSFKQDNPTPVFIKNPTVLHATMPKTDQSTTLSINQSKNEQSCYNLGSNIYTKTVLEEDTPYSRYEAQQNSSVCDWLALPNITAQGFLFSIQTRNISGRPIKTCLSIHPPNICLYETILNVPKQNTWTTTHQLVTPETTNSQWFLELDNYAVGNETRINDVGTITVTPLPYAWLEQLSITQQDIPNIITQPTMFFVHHPNPAFYETTIPSNFTGSLVISQAFDSGWHAYTKRSENIPQKLFEFLPFLFGKEIHKHILINNWANGWAIEDNKSNQIIIIFFLPQILQWIGFLLIPLAFLFIIKHKT